MAWNWNSIGLLLSCLLMIERACELSSMGKLCQPLELNLEKLNPRELSKSLINLHNYYKMEGNIKLK